MATNVIEAVLTATDKSYTSTMQKAMGVTDSFAKKVAGGIGFGALLRAGERAFDGIGNAVKGLVGDIDSTNAAWKSFRSNMEMIGRGAEVDKVKKELQDFAAKTVYTSADMAQTYSQLAAVGTKNTSKLVQGFGMVAAAAENPQQAMKTLSTQATQMAAKPQVAWQDFKLMLEQTPAGISQVAKAMDMTTTELVQNVQDGKVATEDFFNAIIKAADAKELQQMAKQYKTIGQAADGVRATLVNRLAPSWEKINQVGIKRMSDLMTAFAGIDANALADKVGIAVDKIDRYIDKMITNVQKAGGLKNVLAGLASGIGAMSLAFSIAGNNILPSLNYLGGTGKNMLKNFGKTAKSFGSGFVTGFGEAAAAAGKTMPEALSKTLTAFSNFKGRLTAIMGPLQTIMSTGLAALSPALLIGGVLVALGLLNGAFGEQIQSIISTMATKGPEIITSLGESITSALPTLMATGAEILTNLINAIGANIPAIITQGTNILMTLVQGVTAALPQLIPAAMNAIGQFLIGIANALPQLIVAGLQLIVTLVQGIANSLPQLMTAALTAIVQFGIGIITNLPTIIQCGLDILQALVRGIVSGITQIPAAVKSIFGAIKEAITGNTAEVETSGQEQGQALVDNVASSATANQAAIQTAGTDTGMSFGTGLNSALGSMTVDATAMQSSLSALAPQALGEGQTAGTDFGSGLQTAISGISVDTASVTNAMGQAAPQAQTEGQNTGQQFGAGIQSAQGQIQNASKAMTQAATSSLRNGYSKAYSAGAYISQGMAAGMRSALGQIRSAAAAMSAAADAAMRAKAKVSSPSKVTMKTGKFIAQGLAVGMLAEKGKLTSAGKKAVNSVLKAMTKAVSKGKLDKKVAKKAQKLIKNATSAIEKLQKEYQQKLDAINSKKESLVDTLIEGDRFKSKNGKVIFQDFAAETEKLKKLGANLSKLQNLLPRGLLDEIISMDTADQLKYTTAMLQMTEDEIKAYGAQYTEYAKQAQSIADSYFAGDIATIQSQYTNAIAKEFEKLTTKLTKLGSNAMKGFIRGLKSQKKAMNSATLSIAEQVIKVVKKKLKIKSPSRVFEKIGSYTGEGFAIGIDKTQRDVQASIDNMLQAADFNRQMANNRFNGSLSDEYDYNIAARYEIVVPLEINGREFARATADDMTAVQNQKQTYDNRKRGIR